MGKIIGYAFLIMAVLFVLEWFQIVDVPYLEVPDYTVNKKGMIDSKEGALNQTE